MQDIAQCPASWQLLEMFPDEAVIISDSEAVFNELGNLNGPVRSGDPHVQLRLIAYAESVTASDEFSFSGQSNSVVAEKCEEYCGCLFYHCDICREADYDICRDCFEKGVHSLDNDHCLHEQTAAPTFERSYSSVGS